jgi:hypothetical protein
MRFARASGRFATERYARDRRTSQASAESNVAWGEAPGSADARGFRRPDVGESTAQSVKSGERAMPTSIRMDTMPVRRSKARSARSGRYARIDAARPRHCYRLRAGDGPGRHLSDVIINILIRHRSHSPYAGCADAPPCAGRRLPPDTINLGAHEHGANRSPRHDRRTQALWHEGAHHLRLHWYTGDCCPELHFIGYGWVFLTREGEVASVLIRK